MRLSTQDGKPLDLENDAKLPVRAAWLSQGNIWWRVDLFFDELVEHAAEHRKYGKWFSFSQEQLGKTSLVAGPGGLESHVYSPKSREPDPDAAQDDLVSSQGLVRFLFQACWVTRTEAQRSFFRTTYWRMPRRVCVCITIGAHQPLEIHLDESRVPSWFVASTGLVSGFAAWVMNALAVYTSRSMCDLWEDMFCERTLTSSLRDDQEGRVPEGRVPANWENVKTPINDIIAFATMAKYHRARLQSDKPHSLAPTVLIALHRLHKYLSEFMSVGLEFYVIKDYMTDHDTGLAVRVRKANVGKRLPLQNTLHIKSIWNLMEAAAKSGTSSRQALIVKHDERSDLHGSSLCLGYNVFLMLVSQ